MFYKFKYFALTLYITTFLTFTATQLSAGEHHQPSFNEVINQALDYSLSIKGQQQAVSASTSNVYGAYGNWLPHVNASTGNTNVRQRYKTPNVNRVNDDYHYQNNQLTINQSIFNGGKNFASLQHARAGEKAAKARHTSTINQALLEAVDMYIKLYNAMATGKITQNRVDLLKKHKTATETKLKLGSATKTELAETVAELASAEADHASSKSDIERYRAEYLRLTNNTPPAALAKPKYCDNLPTSLALAIENGLKINPDIAQADNQYTQAKANVHSARGDILPKVTFDYNISKPRYNDRLNFNNSDQHSYGINFKIPVFQGGSEWASLKQNIHLREQSRYQSLATTDSVRANITARWHNYKTMNERYKASQAALKAATSAYNGAKAEYENGLRNNIDFLQAEQNMFQAQLKQILSQGDDILASYQLLASVGQLTPEYIGLTSSDQ